MGEPQRIKVVYFDASALTMAKFIDYCGHRDIIEIVAAFGSFSGTAAVWGNEGLAFLSSLAPDVIIIRAVLPEDAFTVWLPEIKRACRCKLVGLLSCECAADLKTVRHFDYHTCYSDGSGFISDDDIFTRLLYQIKTARLTLKTESAGVKGKWAVLPIPPRPQLKRGISVIAIGASAGGTDALSRILTALPPDMPPIIVVQHIPDSFTEFFADNLASKVSIKVAVAHGGEKLEKGTAYIAGDNKHLEIIRSDGGEYYTKCSCGEKVSGHRPSVDVLFRSVAAAAGASSIGVILTGMGSDGAQGLLEMREAGAYTVGQDKDSSAVYGMPMVAYTLGAVCRQLPLSSIAEDLISAVSGRGKTEVGNG